MWMIELMTKTSTAESRIGTHNDTRETIVTSLKGNTSASRRDAVRQTQL